MAGRGQGRVDGPRPPTPDPLPDGPPEKKPRRGRKSKEEKEQEANAAIIEARRIRKERAAQYAPAVEELIAWPFDVVAERRGAFWRLKPDEKKRLAISLAVVMEKWLPDFMLTYEEEIALAIILSGVVIGRLREDERVHPRVKRPRRDGTAPERQDDIAAKAALPATA